VSRFGSVFDLTAAGVARLDPRADVTNAEEIDDDLHFRAQGIGGFSHSAGADSATQAAVA
jgi:hypothetical protein